LLGGIADRRGEARVGRCRRGLRALLDPVGTRSGPPSMPLPGTGPDLGGRFASDRVFLPVVRFPEPEVPSRGGVEVLLRVPPLVPPAAEGGIRSGDRPVDPEGDPDVLGAVAGPGGTAAAEGGTLPSLSSRRPDCRPDPEIARCIDRAGLTGEGAEAFNLRSYGKQNGGAISP